MGVLIATVEGSSGAAWQLARRVSEVTGIDPLRFRRQTVRRLKAKITDLEDNHILLVGKSSGASKLVDVLSTKDAIRWASNRSVVVLSIDCHRPGNNRAIYELQNPHVRRCYSTYQRARWPRGAAIWCGSGNNTIIKQTGVNHSNIIYSAETEDIIRDAFAYTGEGELYWENLS